jgi:hypothetical protein
MRKTIVIQKKSLPKWKTAYRALGIQFIISTMPESKLVSLTVMLPEGNSEFFKTLNNYIGKK